MSQIDQYDLKASAEFPISGTQEVTENLQLTASTISASGVLTGTVTSGGTPVEGATVKVFDISDNPLYHGNTNSVGQYTIPDVVGGTYKVTAAKTGYLTPNVLSVTVSPNRPTTANFSLTADPNAALGTLFGIVRQSVILTPIEGATVNIFQVVDDVRTLISTTLTNSAGQYLSPNLSAGDYIVVSNKTGYDQATSATVTLTVSEIEALDLSMIVNAATNTGTISGIITDVSTGLPIANAIVALYSVVGATETITRITRTNTGGRYLFGNVVTGNYIVKSFAQTTAV